MAMLIRFIPQFHWRKERPRRIKTRPAPPGPVLVQAIYSHEDWLLTLAFDRTIDVSHFDGSQFTVRDGVFNGKVWIAESPPSVLDPMTICMSLDAIEDYAGPDVRMWATSLNGIVAADGGAWEGVSDLVLPFP
jgi:hypothetical protein